MKSLLWFGFLAVLATPLAPPLSTASAQIACTDDAKECPDGSFVGRDPDNNCEFFPCPEGCINPITGELDTPVLCIVDPCEVNTCEANPEATCEANYCGGCHALFYDEQGEQVSCDLPCEQGDTDGDGVCDDLDNCPDTTARAATDASGCSGKQQVAKTCGSVDSCRHRGTYLACVVRASHVAMRAGLLTPHERLAILLKALTAH